MLKYPITLLFVLMTLFSFVQAQIIYVNANSSAANPDGSTWENAYSNLRDALFVANENHEIWLVEGTYKPTTTNDRGATFNVPEGVEIYGGFTGNETERSQRDWENNPTILSGDIGVIGDSTDNSHTILLFIYTDSTTLVDGFTIRDGNADSDDTQVAFYAPLKCGGGAYILGQGGEAAPTIQNCRFEHNHARENGGGLFMNARLGGSVYSSINNCVFEGNTSLSKGGGITFFGGNETIPSQIQNCIFQNNHCEVSGAGIFAELSHGNASLLVQHSMFMHNRAEFVGGAIAIDNVSNDNTRMEMEHLNLVQNEAAEGGAIHVYSLSFGLPFAIAATNFEQNTAFGFGGGALSIAGGSAAEGSDTMRFSSCVFSENFGSSDILLGNESALRFDDCTFQNASSTRLLKLEYIGNVFFNYCVFQNNNSHLITDTSPNTPIPYLSNCIFYRNKGVGIDMKQYFINNSIFIENEYADDAFLIGEEIATVHNSIFYRHEGTIFSNSDSIAITYNLFDTPALPDLLGSNNLFDADPLFTDTAAFDFSLLPCSPAINTGTNSVISPNDLDFLDNPRIIENTVDIGIIESPEAALITSMSTPTACAESNTGEVTVSLINACEPVVYEWVNANENGEGNTNLAAGNYQFTITDGIGRTFETNIEISSGTAIDVEVSSTNIDCAINSSGTAFMTSTTGTAPYSFTWSNNATDSLINDLPMGIYTLTLTDANGCTDSTMVEVLAENELPFTIAASPITCYDAMNGELLVLPQFEGNYDYEWSLENAGNMAQITNLDAGDYTVTVSNEAGCTGISNITISEPEELAATFQITDAMTPDTEDGAIEIVEITGGTMPYTISWDTTFLENIGSGTYAVTITDANGCTLSVEVFVDFITTNFAVSKYPFSIQIRPNIIQENTSYQLIVKDLPYGELHLKCVNTLGQTMNFLPTISTENMPYEYQLIAPKTAGLYYLIGEWEGQVLQIPIVVQ